MAKQELTALAPAFSTSLGAVYNADCIDLLGAVKEGSIDTVFADPPFIWRRITGTARRKTT
jgi:hypothetical protein